VNDDLKDYQRKHQVLLVGGNPLPNVVAGDLLCPPGGTIALVHSPTSKVYAERIKALLPGRTHCFVEVDEADPSDIHSKIRRHLDQARQFELGLSYTGGTKAMSVHAHRTLERWCLSEAGVMPVASYLDARNLELVFDPPDIESGDRSRYVYVGRKVSLTLEQLMQLHNLRLRESVRSTPLLPSSAREIARAISTPAGFAAWQTYREVKAPFRLPTEDVLAEIRIQLIAELGINPSAMIPADALPNGRMSQWLTGGDWLEDEVQRALGECKDRCGLTEVAASLKPNLPDDNFEFDVAAVRGHQLFALSCSIKGDEGGAKGVLKHKLFEALLRAHQLGGDEARVALVCCRQNVLALENEVRRDIDPDGRTRVFGRQHLGNLSHHLAEWIRDQSGRDREWTW
jgi:hypothetical protein